jgi:hypothetical protein
MKGVFLAVLSILILFIAACGHGGGDNTLSPSVNVTGTWSGPYNSSIFGAQFLTMNFQQNYSFVGTIVNGTYSSSTGALGSFSGNLASADTATFTMIVTTPGCSGSFVGIGIVDESHSPNTMSFSYNGSSTCGGQESETGNLTKQ